MKPEAAVLSVQRRFAACGTSCRELGMWGLVWSVLAAGPVLGGEKHPEAGEARAGKAEHTRAGGSASPIGIQGLMEALKGGKDWKEAGRQDPAPGLYRSAPPRVLVRVPGEGAVPLLKAAEAGVRGEVRVVRPELTLEPWALGAGKAAP